MWHRRSHPIHSSVILRFVFLRFFISRTLTSFSFISWKNFSTFFLFALDLRLLTWVLQFIIHCYPYEIYLIFVRFLYVLTLQIQRKFIKFYKFWTGVACISFTNYFGDSSREQSRRTISNDDGSTFFRLSVTSIFNIPQRRLDLHKFSYNTSLHWYLNIIGLINQHDVWNYPQVEKRRYLFTEKITLSVF